MKFDFNEINILKQNLYNSNQTKKSFLEMLQNIYDNTEDILLRDSVVSLMNKIELLPPEALVKLYTFSTQNKITATMNDPFSVIFAKRRQEDE